MKTNNYVVKMNADRVTLYLSSGVYMRQIVSGARFAVVQGDEVHVTMSDGQVASTESMACTCEASDLSPSVAKANNHEY